MSNAQQLTPSTDEILAEMHAPLNPEQKAAALRTEGAVIVVAGAGAGKTKTLIHRAATLLVKGIPATQVMICTFTNKAAQEIRHRLRGMIGDDADFICAGTFHSIVFREILKRSVDSPYLVGQGVNMEQCAIMDEADSRRLLKEALKEETEKLSGEELDEDETSMSAVRRRIGILRALGLSVDDFAGMIDPAADNYDVEALVLDVWRSYTKKCRAMQGVDFDDVLVLTSKMLAAEPELAADLAQRFRYLMLDEYQDTNAVQMQIMDAIASHHGNIFVVGDEKQSIYAFRGADIGVILGFKERYPNAVQFDMSRNYRSYPEIILHANACADAMTQRLSDGQLVACRNTDNTARDMDLLRLNKVSLTRFATDDDEAEILCRAIKRDLSLGLPGKEIAVLYRNRDIKRRLERKLVEEQVPYYLVGDTSFYQRAEVKDAVALTRFVFQPWDSMAALRVIQASRLGISDKAARAALQDGCKNVWEFLNRESDKRLRATRSGQSEPGLTVAARRLRPLVGLCDEIRRCAHYEDSPETISKFLSELWNSYLRPKLEASKAKAKDNTESTDSRISNALFIFDRVRQGLAGGQKIDEVIEDLTLMVESNPDHDKDLDGKVRLMTLHASKGLEFDSVFVLGLDADTMPGKMPADSFDSFEEARRLLYVGMTRAKKKLVCSTALERVQYGERVFVEPSPFIEEIEQRLGVKPLIYGRLENESALER